VDGGQLAVLVADFLHGGIAGGNGARGCVFLSPKAGDRSRLKPEIQAQLDRMGVKPREVLNVHLVDSTPDLDDKGVPSHIEVDGTLAWVDDGFGWRAFYDTDSVAWVPDAEPDRRPDAR
jgi:hypothetical protein